MPIQKSPEMLQKEADDANRGILDPFYGEQVVPYDPDVQKTAWGGQVGAAETEAERLKREADALRGATQGAMVGGYEGTRDWGRTVGAATEKSTTDLVEGARAGQTAATDIAAGGSQVTSARAAGAQGREPIQVAPTAVPAQVQMAPMQEMQTVGGPAQVQRTTLDIARPDLNTARGTQAAALTAAGEALPTDDLEAARAIRAQQLGLAQRYQQFAEQGPPPSAAEVQLRMGVDAANAAAVSLARSGRGPGGNAAAMREAMFANAAANQQMNQQLAQLRAEEEAGWRGQQLEAMGGEAAALGGARGQDIQTGQTGGALALDRARLESDIGVRQGDLELSATDLEARQRVDRARLELDQRIRNAELKAQNQELSTQERLDLERLKEQRFEFETEVKVQQGQWSAEFAESQKQFRASLTVEQRAQNDALETSMRGLGYQYDQLGATAPAQYLALQKEMIAMGLGTQVQLLQAEGRSLEAQYAAMLGFAEAANNVGLGYEELAQTPMMAELKARVSEELARSANVMGAQTANQQADLERDQGFLGLGVAGLGALAGLLSDVNAKTNITPMRRAGFDLMRGAGYGQMADALQGAVVAGARRDAATGAAAGRSAYGAGGMVRPSAYDRYELGNDRYRLSDKGSKERIQTLEALLVRSARRTLALRPSTWLGARRRTAMSTSSPNGLARGVSWVR